MASGMQVRRRARGSLLARASVPVLLVLPAVAGPLFRPAPSSHPATPSHPAPSASSSQEPAPASGDWPHWRGPTRTGVSAEAGWTSSGTPVWERNVGLGHSSFAVVGGRLFTLGFDRESGEDVVWCLDVRTGDDVWSLRYPAHIRSIGHGGGTLTTPAVQGGRVYLTNREGEVRCLDAVTGELLWLTDLADEEGVESTDYGFGGSPLVLEEALILNANRTFALEKETGEVLWRTRAHLAMYSTPQEVRLRDRPSLAVFSKEGLLVLDRATGDELHAVAWRKGPTTVNASTPVVVADDRLFVSSGYGHGGALVDFSSGTPEIVWETKAMRTQLSGCVLVEGFLYGFDEKVLKCLGLDGKERWRKRGLGMGALSAADGRLLVTSSKGELVVAAASPDRYEELARVQAVPGGALWATPVLAGGRVFCRNGDGDLACLDHRAAK